MPTKSQEYCVPLAFRLTPEQAAVVDSWGKKLGLSRPSVIRLLIACARANRGLPRVDNPAAWSEETISAKSGADEENGHGVG